MNLQTNSFLFAFKGKQLSSGRCTKTINSSFLISIRVAYFEQMFSQTRFEFNLINTPFLRSASFSQATRIQRGQNYLPISARYKL